ncbi:MAG TPA: nitrile hydratase subunit beta [Caulobacteraceae bacterium]|nr:nitrile hydratase subunit beta [Caulobacteraceae bacterium]
MNGAHDMGGMHGLGPILPEPDEPVFHAPWEARVLALTVTGFGWRRWTVDRWRHQHEKIPGADYLRMSYYEKWATSLAGLMVEAGLATRAEVEPAWPAIAAPQTAPEVFAGEPAATPSFKVGDRVRTRNINPSGHTRLPRYARGHAGVVTRLHGAHVLPDASAHDRGDRRQPLYQVRFEAAELWGLDARGRGAVHLDLWEDYLDRA